MSSIVLEAKSRKIVGTGSARSDRRNGLVPCVIYGDKKEPESICIPKDLLNRYVNKSNFFSTVFEMEGVGKKGQKFIAKDIQFHPVTDRPLHVDFMRVVKGSKITVRVPLVFINETASPGLKLGGVLNVLVHEIDVVCDPDDIPENVAIDLTGCEFHHTIHVEDVSLPNNISLPVNCKNFTIATVVAPTVMKKETDGEDGSAAAGAAKSPADAPTASQ